ncbi:hypothetical protein [Priestia megaterium]|uniref:hypothetical protein n=1 Tax=Priestia megaterium TaxID=1404 RepID=UPI00211D09A2|nr:hypothetical protein [Priestia megaterium]
MEQKEVVLINKSGTKLYINFKKAFPQDKSAKDGAKIYLTPKEWEWCQFNIPETLEKGLLVLEGSEEAEKETENPNSKQAKLAEFFDQHVNKAKSQAAKIESLDEVNALIDYANDNEIDNKAVDALIKRANELSE